MPVEEEFSRWWAAQNLREVTRSQMAELFPDKPFNVSKQKEIIRRFRLLVEEFPDIRPKELAHRVGVRLATVYSCYQKIYGCPPKHLREVERLKEKIRQMETRAEK